jgi:molybdopterin-containing oxidoreductase family iron-sulfur binding subunit
MNQALGNIGSTVTYGASIEPRPVDHVASLAELATAMDAGQVQLLVIMGNNPVYTAPVDLKFAERLTKVGVVVYHGLYQDETAALATGTSRTHIRSKAGATLAPTTARSR